LIVLCTGLPQVICVAVLTMEFAAGRGTVTVRLSVSELGPLSAMVKSAGRASLGTK
jgi:hypothetical protein